MSARRILYIQYTNPAGYPPLQHSSRILAKKGWEVLFLGTVAQGASSLTFPTHEKISVLIRPYCAPGWRQKFHYLGFIIWCLYWTIRWRPDWIYASDPLSCPVAWVVNILLGVRILYHEHDSPTKPPKGFIGACRRSVARRAQLCVLPNSNRITAFSKQTGRQTELFCVWNCPSKEEIGPTRHACDGGRIWLLYHGSINKERLPLSILQAMTLLPESLSLRVVGYETMGSQGYLTQMRAEANRLALGDRLEILGALSRSDLFSWCSKSDIGLAFMPMRTTDINMVFMTGASNKPFDYLARGLSLLVSDLPDWRELYVKPGYAVVCDPLNTEDLTRAIKSFLDRPAKMREMGERGRQRIETEWNYESTFAPILDILTRAKL